MPSWLRDWPALVRWTGALYSIVALFAFGYALFSGHLGVFLGEQAPTLAGVLGAFCLGLVVLAVVHLGTRVWPAVGDAVVDLSALIGRLRIRDVAVLAGVSAVAEELLFRGALWPTLGGIVGTTLLFGLVHVVPRRALWGYPLYALFVGLLLGVLRGASGSVILPIVAHFTINFGALWWMTAREVTPAGGPSSPAAPMQPAEPDVLEVPYQPKAPPEQASGPSQG